MNTLKKNCFAYSDQPPKKQLIGGLQGNKGTFPLHRTLSQNHISLPGSITSAIATPFFISSLKMWPRSGNHRTVSVYSFLKSFSFVMIIHKDPFRFGDLYPGYVQKVAWRLSPVAEQDSVSRPSNAVFL